MQKINYHLSEIIKTAEHVINGSESQVILFYGEMGTGKTTLTKAICQVLQCPDTISSPTFSLVNEYRCTRGKIFHFDFYRIQNEEEAWEIGFEEYLEQDGFKLIEWPEKIPHLLPESRTTVHLKKNGANQRTLTLENLK